jgi:hypothetical protein
MIMLIIINIYYLFACLHNSPIIEFARAKREMKQTQTTEKQGDRYEKSLVSMVT